MNKLLSDRAARIISTIFVPPSFTIIVFTYFAFMFETDPFKRFIVISVALTFGFILHVFLFLFFRRKGMLADMDASIKEERTLPFAIAVLFYLTGLFILIYEHVNIISIAFWFCYISNTIIIILINKYWKISAHAMGASGPLAAVVFAAGVPGLWLAVIPAIVGWSRIKLKCHSLSQVLAGAALGFVSTYLQMLLITGWFNNVR